MYKSAIKLFKFSEVNGINLGFSESEHGVGFGEKLRKQVINLFEENIGSDRLSDMVATIIYPDIVKFTKRIQDEIGINKEILHELPIAKCWDDIDRVVSENVNIRREINEAVGEE